MEPQSLTAYELIVASGTPGEQFRVDSITGPASGFTVSGPTTVTGNYITQYQVTFAASPPAGGSITTPPSSPQWYDAGATGVSISATPNFGYTFSSWSATTGITINNPSSASTTATINNPGTITATFTVITPSNLIRNPGFEVDNATWVGSVNNLDSDRANRYYNNNPRSGTRDGRTDSRSPNNNGYAYAILTQNLVSTAVSSIPDITNSLTVYLRNRGNGDGVYTVEVRIYSGSTMLSYIWCTTSQLPSDTSTLKYIRIGDVSSISTTSDSSLIRNLRADWISKGLSTSLQIDRIQLVSNGNHSSGNDYGQDIVWDDLQLLYYP